MPLACFVATGEIDFSEMSQYENIIMTMGNVRFATELGADDM